MIRKLAISGGLALCLLLAWIYEENRCAKGVRPPEGATNLVAFLRARPQPIAIRKFAHNGKVHVEVLGKPILSPLSVPSGPPAYIFDETGAFVDWAADRDENPPFVRRWGSLSNATIISVDEAKQLVKAHER